MAINRISEKPVLFPSSGDTLVVIREQNNQQSIRRISYDCLLQKIDDYFKSSSPWEFVIKKL